MSFLAYFKSKKNIVFNLHFTVIPRICQSSVGRQSCHSLYTGCLMKNASTHNFFIYDPISMNKKIKDMVFQALQNSHKIYFFWRYLQ
jgi:hypothetical protein